jgi:Arc/MetJ family transcription regulator
MQDCRNNLYATDSFKAPFPLTIAYRIYILMHIIRHIMEGESVRTTLNIEDALLDKATKLTGIKEKTSLVRLGLQALMARESGKRLAKMGGNRKGA